MLHWNGIHWREVPYPTTGYVPEAALHGQDPRQVFVRLTAVTALSAHDIWAVGNYDNGKPPKHTLTEHWNGTSWMVVASPNVGTDLNSLESVARVPGTHNVWAVGEYFDTAINAWRTLAEYYS